MKTTTYFETVASVKHPEVKKEWIERVRAHSVKRATQPSGRISFWGNIPEMEGRVLRVVTLEDGETVHNAYFDRNFYRRQQRGEEPN